VLPGRQTCILDLPMLPLKLRSRLGLVLDEYQSARLTLPTQPLPKWDIRHHADSCYYSCNCEKPKHIVGSFDLKD
jgi:hypothetical protein